MLRHLPVAAWTGALLLALSCAGPQRTSHQPDSLRIVTPGDYAPFASCTKSSPPVCEGFDVDLVKSYAAHRGMAISWSLSTWSSLAKDLEDHDMAIGGITIRDERSAVGPFGDTTVHTGKQALLRCANTERFGTWEAIEQDARIVANLGGGNERFARAHFLETSVLIVRANDEVPAFLLRGEADVFFTDGPEAALLARTHESLCIGLEGKLHEPFDLALWFGPTALKLRDDFNGYLRSEPGRGRLRELRVQYELP